MALLSTPARYRSGAKCIAVTVDDLPMATTTPRSQREEQAVNDAILGSLKKYAVRAVGFVNEDRLYREGDPGGGIRILEAWLDAGMELGNHTFDHVGLWTSSRQACEDAVLKGEAITRPLTARRGQPLRFFRHPFTQTGKDEEEKAHFEEFLARHGYRVAPFTIEHDDQVFAHLYDRLPVADESGRRRLIDSCLDHLDHALAAFETMSQELFDRQIPQILLIHASALNADSLDRTLARLVSRGYGFTSLEEALMDPAYCCRDLPSGRFGPSWLARWAAARGQRLSVQSQPDLPAWMMQAFDGGHQAAPPASQPPRTR